MENMVSESKVACQYCGTKFGYKSSLIRHQKKKCNQPQAPNVRRKSCTQCAVDKTRCNLKRPSCSRCLMRGTPCQYLAPASMTPSDVGTPEASATPDSDVAGESSLGVHPSALTLEDNIDSKLLSDILFPNINQLDNPQQDAFLGIPPYMGNMDVMTLHDSATRENSPPGIVDLIPQQYLFSPPPSEAVTAALATHSMEFILRVLRTWPRMMAEEFQLPPLIHPTQVKGKVLPLPLANCITLTKMWNGQCEGAEDIVKQTILKEVDGLLDRCREYDEITLLAALQAMVMYNIMLLFPSKTQAEIMSGDHTIFVKIQRIVYHVVGTGLFLQEEREQARPSWDTWIHVTSKRRAILSLYLLHWAYSVWHDVPSFDCKELGFMPAPAAKVLWQATTEEEWNAVYTRWLARWNGRAYLQAEFDRIRPGIKMDPRAERWLEETDEFGFIMISIVNATDRSTPFSALIH